MVDTAFINSATVDSASTTSVVIAKPVNTAEFDIMFALIMKHNNAAALVVPAGWTLAGAATVNGILYPALYYRVAGAGEGANYTWSWAGATRGAGTICTYRGGFDTADPIDVVSNTGYVVVNTTVRAASMNVAEVDSNLIFAGLIFNSGIRSFTKPSEQDNDWVEDFDGGAQTSDFWRTLCHCNWSGSGASGVMDAISSVATADKHAFAVALNTISVPATSGMIIFLSEAYDKGKKYFKNKGLYLPDTEILVPQGI